MRTYTKQPSAKDTWLNEFSKTGNFGNQVDLYLYDLSGWAFRSILEFDISALPAGATLISASLQLYYTNYAQTNPSGKTVWAYKLTRTDWVEIEATWNIYKTSSDWTAAGGDYVTSDPSGGSTTFPASAGAWISWDVLAIVQDAYDAGNATEFLVRFETEGLASGHSQPIFWSNNYTIDTSLCPKLVIEYTPPPSGSGGFAQAAMALLT